MILDILSAGLAVDLPVLALARLVLHAFVTGFGGDQD
jgi:hypothetical protein